MSKPTITIHDVSTGEIVVREMNDAEFEQHQIDVAKRQARAAAVAEHLATQAAAKSALLSRLGMTDDEAKLLLS